MKQSKLRRRRVVRYAILYFVLLAVFVGLIAGPVVAGKQFKQADMKKFYDQLQPGKMILIQPNFLSNNDTQGDTETGTAAPNYTPPADFTPTNNPGGGGGAQTTATTTGG